MQDLSDIPAVILAGGLGTRLRSVVADRPKVLAEIRGRPFLAYLLDQLVSASVKYVVLCTGYLGEQIQSCFGDSYREMRLVYSQEPAPLGTAGALRLAMPLFHSDAILVMNGDSFCKVDLRAFTLWHSERRADATILLTEVPDTGRYGRVNVEHEGLIQSFHEKGRERGPGWINAGIYLLSQRVLLKIPKNGLVSLEREIFPGWMGRGLYGYRNPGDFLDIGTPASYAEADRFFATV